MVNRVYRLMILIFAFAWLASACSQAADQSESTPTGLPKNADGYVDITAQQLAGMMPDKDFTLVNVHIPFAGDIPDTDLSIPFDQIEEKADQLPDKDAPIVLYCRSGSMSTQAARALVALGYTRVMELNGGLQAWEAAGYKLAGE